MMDTLSSMLERTQCPLGEDGSSACVLRLPYSQPRFANVVQDYPDAAALEYCIYHNPTLDFYWQSQTIDASAFDISADANQTHLRPVSGLPTYTHVTEEAILIRQMFGDGDIKVFDFGMGDGLWLKMMQAYGMSAHGYDVAAFSQSVARRHAIDFVPLEDYPDNSFDVIAAREVFEHLPDPLSTAKLIAKKLKPNGLFIISTPHNKRVDKILANLKAGAYTDPDEFDRQLDCLGPMQHINHFSPKAMLTMAKAAGLAPRQLSLRHLVGATTGLYSARQLNRAFYNPIKRYQTKSCLKFFTKVST